MMGSDIHGVFQRRNQKTNAWEDITSSYDFNRDYQLFAVLANVRNGIGFAGIPTGEAVKPISEPRGLPTDFDMSDDDHHPIVSLEIMSPWRRKYHADNDPLHIWMGDHSFSWLNGDEMLTWYANAPVVVKTGVLDRTSYEKWNHVLCPEFYSGGISGPNIEQINDNEDAKKLAPNWTHIRCQWKAGLKEELAYFFDEVKRLTDEHSEIRFVFGFDS